MDASGLTMSSLITLTGEPGGGKTAPLRELAAGPEWRGRILPLPAAPPKQLSSLDHSI